MNEDKNKSKSQKRFEDNLKAAYDSRKTSCFMTDGGDWADRWEELDLYALPRLLDSTEDTYRSNTKSPEILGRIQSAMHKLVKMNLSFSIRPQNSAAKIAARIDQLIVNHFFKQQASRSVLNDAFYTAITKGTAPIGVEWLRKEREVSQVITNPEKMTAAQKKKVKKGELVYAKVKQVDVNGPVLIDYPLTSVYLDPSARNMHGQVHNCGFAYVVELISFESFKSNFLNKDGFKNTDKVEAVSKDMVSKDGIDVDTFKYLFPPTDTDGEYVMMIHGWDYYHDEFKVCANGVYIKETPLPYSDKWIPMSLLKPYVLPGQIYGVGMVDFLIPSVYQLELIQNAFYDWLIYTINPILLVQSNEYGNFSRKYQVVNGKPGALLPVEDLNNSVAPLKYPTLSVDVFQGIASLQKDAILASQHDPNQLGVLRKDTTATANIMNKDISEAFVNYIADNFTSSLEEIVRMVVNRIHEFMTQKDVSKLVNGEDASGEPFEIAIPGKYVDIDWDERTLRIEDNPEKVAVIKITDKLYQYEDEDGNMVKVTPNDYEIELSAESKQIMSKALEQQRISDAMKTIMPYAIDPKETQKNAMNPNLQLFNAIEIADQYVDAMALSPKILLNRSENEKADIKKAEEQNVEMYNGKRAMPKAGESATHIQIHVDFQQTLIHQLETMKIDIQSSIEAGMQPTPEQQQSFDRIKRILPLMSEHIDFDTTSPQNEAAMMSAAGKMAAPQQEGPVQAPDTKMSQSVTQSGMGADQPTPDNGMPNMPQDAGVTQGGAGPLTKM